MKISCHQELKAEPELCPISWKPLKENLPPHKENPGFPKEDLGFPYKIEGFPKEILDVL